MPSAFSITTTTNAIILDVDRRGLVVFTVSNQLGRSVRVRTSVSAFAPTPPDWFKIEGEAERLFPPGGSEAFNVRISAPPTAPVGQNAFRLDAVSADRPDDEWAHGPLVGFEIAPTPVIEPPKPKPVPNGYLETVLGALAGTLLALVLVTLAAVIQYQVNGWDMQWFPQSFSYHYALGQTVALALAGAIGAVIGLVVRNIPDPAPWRTGLALGVLATAGLIILSVIVFKSVPAWPDGAASIIADVVGSLVIVVVLSLVARAIGRFLSVGRL